MLSDKDGVVSHRRLPAVIGRASRGQSGGDKIAGVLYYDGNALLVKIFSFFLAEVESAAKSRPPQSRKNLIYITHKQIIRGKLLASN